MSAETSGDVSRINDEDVLRQMWQDTADFGRKKEIRAHMYKLREARLSDFYKSGEVNTDIQRTTSTKTTTESKSCATPTHADSLADHSFISMKTKEIRDSESPTRDVSYRITSADKLQPNQGWQVVTSNKTSDDGKTFTTAKIATTSGTEKIDGGKIDYAAKNEQKASVYRDGDDKNFTKSVGASSNTVIKQEASGGDESSGFKSSSTKTSSSSQVVTEQRSSSGDVTDNQMTPARMITHHQDDSNLVSRKTYTDNIPHDLKSHPSYVEGKTKVTRETRTLPDGTSVTTTRYEIRGGTTNQSSNVNKFSTNEQRSSTTSASSTSKVIDSGSNQNEVRTHRYIEEPSGTSTKTITREFYDSRDNELQPAINITVSKTGRGQHVDKVNDNINTSTSTTRTTVVKQHRDSYEEPQTTTRTTVVKSHFDTHEQPQTTTKTTVVRNVQDLRNSSQAVDNSNATTTSKSTVVKSYDIANQIPVGTINTTTTKTTVVKDIYDTREQPRVDQDSKTTTCKTTVVKNIQDTRDNRRQSEDHTSTHKVNRNEQNERFIAVEQLDTQNRSETITPKVIEPTPQRSGPKPASPERQPRPQEKYETPDRRQPIKPGKSELDDKRQPTDGQYETTYRTDFTNKRISVDVSPTHEAFARSLRAVSPDRISKCSSPSRSSLRTSNTSLRSSTSPEKNRHPTRFSPDRRSLSPRKNTSSETITYSTRSNTDSISRKNKTNEIDSSTLTRKKNKPRSQSPTSVASDIEYIRNTDIVTDLDTNETTVITKDRPSSLEITRKTSRTVTDRSLTSPLTDVGSPRKSPQTPKDGPRKDSLRNVSPTKVGYSPRSDRPLKRTDTYEERCRQILGITNGTDKRRSSIDKVTTTTSRGPKPTSEQKIPTNGPYSPTRKSPEKKMQEFPSQVRKSPEKNSFNQYPERQSPVKGKPTISEFPSQIRKSPEKEVLGRYPEKSKVYSEPSKINEFPSQIRRSPEKEPLGRYPEKSRTTTDAPIICEFPSQIRRSPEREPLGKYPEKTKATRDSPQIAEFPSQIRRSPEKEPLGSYPEKSRPIRDSPQIDEFPSQIRRSPEREPLERYPEKTKPVRSSPQIDEFPSQIRRSPEREPLGRYPEKTKPIRDSPQIDEFPSQIRRSPEREPLERYPEKTKPVRSSPQIDEFPSQTKRSPEREPLGKYPEKAKPIRDSPQIDEFPSQIRRSPEKEPLERYPEKTKPVRSSPQIDEFPSQIRRSPEREPLGRYPEKTKPVRSSPQIDEFPSQIRGSPEREPLGIYPEKTKPVRSSPQIDEFPSQIRRSPEREPLGRYPEKAKPTRDSPQIDEFPSQVRRSPEKSPEKETLEPKETRKLTGKPEKEFRLHPTSPSKKEKPKKIRPTSTSSTSTDEEENVEEVTTRTRVTDLEGRVPVEEPIATKRFINQLCKDDEIQRTDITTRKNKNAQTLLEKEIIQSSPKTPNKTVKKESPKKTENGFIEKERIDTEITINKYTKPTLISQTKKPLTEKNNVVLTTIKTRPTKLDTKTTKKTVDDHKTSEKITLYDIENLNDLKEDNRVHIRTHRVDDTVNRKTNKITRTGDVTKKATTTTTTTSTSKRPCHVKPEEPKPKKPVESRSQKIVTTASERESRRTTTIDQKTPKRHVVTATITVSPKTKPSPTNNIRVTSKTVTTKTKKVAKKPKIQNGHISSDDESISDSLDGEIIEDVSTSVEERGKMTRTTSEQIFKNRKPETRTPVRGLSKPELLSSKTKPEKCITTKTVTITDDSTKREVIVDLQRSKSSREPTPDRVCPLPVSEYSDDMSPRYPDQITEPDDGSLKRRPKKLSDIPIMETEDVSEFTRITDVSGKTTRKTVNTVEEADESLLNVNKKVNKFLDTTQTVKKTPAPKVERPKLDVDENLESDECLLSVSQKVNKFVTTAEQLTAPQDLPPRPKSPKCQYYPDENVNVSDKVSHFTTTSKKVTIPQRGPTPKVERPNFEHIDETIKEDECLLSVSDKVNKFITTAEKLTNENTTSKVSLSKIDVTSTKKSGQPQDTSPARSKEGSPTRKPDTQFTKFSPKKTVPTSPKEKSPTRANETTPTRRPSNQYSSIKTEVQESKYSRRETSPKISDSTPKSTRRPNEEEPKSVLSPTGRLRSTESVKKAKEIFENINKDREILKQRDILSRPSVFEGRKTKTEVVRKLDYDSEEDQRTFKSTRLVTSSRQKSPEITRSRPSRSPERIRETESGRSQSPDSDVPGYMRPLDRSLRPNSPHRDNISQLNNKYTSIRDEVTEDVRQTKFGVTLKRTDSGRAITTSTTAVKSGLTIEGITEEDIEEIYNIEFLEELLEKIVGYDIRRKIRAQIRLVKTLISEGKLVEVITKKTTRERSPTKITKQTKESSQNTTEYQSSYAYNERRSSSEYSKVTRKSQSPDKTTRAKSPEMVKSTRGKSPEKTSVTKTTTSKLFQSQLKKTAPTSKPVKEDNTPEWVKQRNLKKSSERSTSNRSSRNTRTTTTTKKFRSSPSKEVKTTDIITSGYGVGPTDENGTPLFGLKALRANNKTDTKVQGTVIKSQYYSENGKEPVGEISVTKYSTDPRDLGRNENIKTKGVTSITTTQKFGYKDTPSLKNLTSANKKREICDALEDEVITTKSTTTKVNRRNSVKALSQKFIDNAVETSRSERQTSYPKAGLILRTSSFKESASSDDSREGSTERTVTVKTSTTKTSGGQTFLTNRNKVSGVQDVITRMKTDDRREGDSNEDIEARGLLNRFLGSQVILSALESNVKSSTGGTKRSTKVTTTITEGGKPVTRTRVFQHPISDEELNTIWDEQTLRLLLEQSTDYEERKSIRARLRQVMAEQEACTDLVEKASQEQVSTTIEGAKSTSSRTSSTVTEGPATTTQVTTRVTTQQTAKKPLSPFAKFRQLDKQNSLNSPSTPKTPSGSGPLFKFTDPALTQSASTIKDRLLHWCRMKTKEYENIQLDNFSTSWADGLAFCALIHHFLPDAFDYHALSPKNRRHNFTLAFQVADEKADIAPLLDVDDMVATRKADWKCVFTYVQSIYRRFKDED